MEENIESEADKKFKELHYNKMIENWQEESRIIYTSRYYNHRHSQDRVIEFSNQTGLSIRQRNYSNMFLTKSEIEAILLKINELENQGWYFRK